MPKAKVTLVTVLNALKGLNAKIDKIDAKVDDRFELVKDDFQRLEGKVQTGFAEVRKDLTVIRNQTAHVTERITKLEKSKEGSPRA